MKKNIIGGILLLTAISIIGHHAQAGSLSWSLYGITVVTLISGLGLISKN